MKVLRWNVILFAWWGLCSCAPETVEPPTDVEDQMDPRLGIYERIEPDLSNLRGATYIPAMTSYSPVFGNSPPPNAPLAPDGTPFYLGIANSTAVFRYFHEGDVDHELRALASHGFNAIRFYLSYAAYVAEPARFQDVFSKFLQLAHKHRLYVIAVLFDAYGVEPTLQYNVGPITVPVTPYENLFEWNTSLFEDDFFNATAFYERPNGGEDFVRTALTTAQGSNTPGPLIWEVLSYAPHRFGNEFIDLGARVIKQEAPEEFVSVAVASVWSSEEVPWLRQIAGNDDIDFLGITPWGVFKENIVNWASLARYLVRQESPHKPKPFYASKIGTRAWMQPYEYVTEISREEGMGFFVWHAISGPDLASPFAQTSGLLYGDDGSARDTLGLQAMHRFAQEDGIGAALLAPIQLKPELTPGWRPHAPIGYNDANPADFAYDLQQWTQRRLVLDATNWEDRKGLWFQGSALHFFSTSMAVFLDLLSPGQEATLQNYLDEWDLNAAPRGGQGYYTGTGTLNFAQYNQFLEAWGNTVANILSIYGLEPVQ